MLDQITVHDFLPIPQPIQNITLRKVDCYAIVACDHFSSPLLRQGTRIVHFHVVLAAFPN